MADCWLLAAHHRHRLADRLIRLTDNVFTGLELTGVETCYKMTPARFLNSIPLYWDDFAIEIELSARRAVLPYRLTEAPTNSRARNRKKGKETG